MSPPANTTPSLVAWLRAAGEITRLRLLTLCAERDLSVSDLAAAIGQSEPRVSRHLKILSEAGLVERLRRGQWVHYRAVTEGAAAAFVQGLMAQLDRAEALLARDRQNLSSKGGLSMPILAETRLGRALSGFLERDSGIGHGAAIVVGVEHLELLAVVARQAESCVALAHSRRAGQAVRAFAEKEGLKCRVLTATSESISARDVEKAGQPFRIIVLDRIAGRGSQLHQDLAVARQALVPGGHLWLFEKYESLENGRGRVVEHPIGRVRRILGDAGFVCEKLSPIEADGQHVLAASSVVSEKSHLRSA